MDEQVPNLTNFELEFNEVQNPLFLSVSEASKIGGITTKTVRRGIQTQKIRYKIVQNRYSIELVSLLKFLHSNTKLRNKFYTIGFGQYIIQWNQKHPSN